MERTRFEQLVSNAVAGLPQEFIDKLDNLDIVVEDLPLKSRSGNSLLLGLYEGVPAVSRGTGYNMVAPDKITIYQDSIESIARTDSEIELKVQEVVLHEVAHHFGINDRRLDEIAAAKRSKPGRP